MMLYGIILASCIQCSFAWISLKNETGPGRFSYGAVSLGSLSYVIGGFEPSGSDPEYIPVARVASFDTNNNGTWSEGLPIMPAALGGIAAGADNTTGTIIIAGGTVTAPTMEIAQPDPGTLTDAVYTLNVQQGAWRTDVIPPLPMTSSSEKGDRTDAGGVVCGNGTSRYFFVVGGRRFSEAVNDWVVLGNATVYDLVNNAWSEFPQLNAPRHQHGIACDSVNGRVFVVGGSSKNGQGPNARFALDVVEMFDLNNPTQGWQLVSSLNIARTGLAATIVANTLLAIGGDGLTDSATVERLDLSLPPNSAKWTFQPPLNTARGYLSATTLHSPMDEYNVCAFSGLHGDNSGMGNCVECTGVLQKLRTF
eukprot:m.8795 g.8795  ORF g.8795 m.8795 type:complete len:365 (-) comp3958_c0_seq1:58-1152(-)